MGQLLSHDTLGKMEARSKAMLWPRLRRETGAGHDGARADVLVGSGG